MSTRIVLNLKPGTSPYDITSYRSIALASCVGKMMERITLASVYCHLECCNLYLSIMSGLRDGSNSIDSGIGLALSVLSGTAEGPTPNYSSNVFRPRALSTLPHGAIWGSPEDLGIRRRLYRLLIFSYRTGIHFYIQKGWRHTAFGNHVGYIT